MPKEEPQPSLEELTERIGELETANEELATRLEESAQPATPRHGLGRSVLAGVLILLASLLSPLAITATWFAAIASDTEAFVATYAPLIDDERVQSYLTDQISSRIEERIDVEGLVAEAIGALSQNLQRPAARAALESLQQPLVMGVGSTIRSATARAVASDAFSQIWRTSLRQSHAQLTGVLGGEADTAVAITPAGLELRLAPLISRVREELIAGGFTFASRIPVIDSRVLVLASDSLVQVKIAYQGALIASYWLPLAVLALAATGVLVSRRHASATIWAGVGIGLGAAAVLAAETTLRILAQVSAAVPPAVLLLFFDATFVPLRELAVAGLTFAVVMAVVAWLSEPFAPAKRLREAYAALTGWLRERAESVGLSSGKLGEWLFRYRVATRVVVGAAAVAWLVANRPITTGLVGWTAAIALLILGLLSLLQRPKPDAGVEVEPGPQD